MPYEFRAQRRVEFSDTDLAGIMHYSNFFRFMETAEHAFYRALGFSVTMPGTDPRLGWPRVHAACDFSRPLCFEDLVEIHLLVAEKRSRTLTFAFRFRKLNAEPVVEVARGRITTVCVAHRADGTMAAVPIPKEIADQVQVAPPELLA
jgi:acyl-CoA thioester hydrolase